MQVLTNYPEGNESWLVKAAKEFQQVNFKSNRILNSSDDR